MTPWPKANYKWRVVDIVVAAMIAVAFRRHFLGLGHCLLRPRRPFEGVSAFEGLLNGFWLFAGPLAAIIVRTVPHCLPENPRRLP